MTLQRRRLLGVIAGLLVVLVAGLFLYVRSMGAPPVDPALIARAVHQEPELLEAAWQLPAARTYPKPLLVQQNPSFCGPTSVANVLRSFGVTADATGVLSGTGLCWSGLCFGGLTLDELAGVARKSGRRVTVLRDLTPDQFRDALRRANDPARRFIANFSRQPIFQAGGGHFSPIGGYLEDRELVLVLDVNERYRPWLVERAKLFSAVDTVDSSTGLKRGLLELE